MSGLPLVALAGLAGLGMGGERSQVRSWVVWPPHVCTKEPAFVTGVRTWLRTTASAAFPGPSAGPRTLRNAGASAVGTTACLIRFWLRLLAGGFGADGLGLGRGEHCREPGVNATEGAVRCS